MYLVLSVTLSFMITVNICSKINSVVSGNKIFVTSLVDNILMDTLKIL